MLWIRENQPEVWAAGAKFGHTNTYVAKRLTGRFAIDPSTISISGMYNSAKNDLTWNHDVLDIAGVPESKLPDLMHSYEPVGRILPEMAEHFGLPKDRRERRGAGRALGRYHGAGRHQQRVRHLRNHVGLPG